MIAANKKVIAKRVFIYENLLMKFLGLRFSRKLRDEAVVLVNKNESKINSMVDMFFVPFSLNILWLDRNFRVVDKARLRPFTFRFPKKKAKYIVEMKANNRIKIGDKIEIKGINQTHKIKRIKHKIIKGVK